MPVLSVLDGSSIARVVATYRDALRAHQEELNRLNVYPVPDGDTGTNMALTLESVCRELGVSTRMDDVCDAVAHGSLMGARGNSGVILSQILRGFADTFRGLDGVGPGDLVDRAPDGRRRRVPGGDATGGGHDPHCRPVAAEAAESARAGGEERLDGLLEVVVTEARAAVRRTPDLLPVLKEAGVVDAGGHGFALMLDAFLTIVDGRPLPEPEIVATPAVVAAHRDDVSTLRYEVMFMLDAVDSTIPAFKDAWGAVGDSIVVVGGDGLWNCHIHTNDIGAAIEAGVEAGRPSKIRVTDLVEQVQEEEEWVRRRGGAGSDVATTPVTTAVVAVAVGEGMRRLLQSLGVHAVVAGDSR